MIHLIVPAIVMWIRNRLGLRKRGPQGVPPQTSKSGAWRVGIEGVDDDFGVAVRCMEILEHIKPFGSPGAHAFREELIAEVELRLNRYHEGAAEDVLKKRGI